MIEKEVIEHRNQKMRKKKVVRDKILATKTEDKYLVIANTGKGTCSFSMARTQPHRRLLY